MDEKTENSKDAVLRQQREIVESYAQSALKSAILINGGATIALLAFVGSIWSEDSGSGSTSYLAIAIVFFAFGVFFAAIAVPVTYWAHSKVHNYYQILFSQEHPIHMSPNREKLFELRRRGRTLLIQAIVCVMFSYVLFFGGIIWSYLWIIGHWPSE